MVCRKCVQGAPICPKGTVDRQYNAFSLKGRNYRRFMVNDSMKFLKNTRVTQCRTEMFRYRYFPETCLKMQPSVSYNASSKPRVNIISGLHPYQNVTSLISKREEIES